MWDRGNVVLGIHGIWNGHHTNDRRFTHMDLGLTVSNDALHHREPVPDFPFVSSSQDGWYTLPDGDPSITKYPALIQGQGFENIGDETMFWYGPWPEQISDGVRVATWKRDRLGYVSGYLKAGLQGDYTSHMISAPIDLEGQPARVALNVDGVGEYGHVEVEVLNEQLTPCPGYERAQAIPVSESGLRQYFSWEGNDQIVSDGRIRLRFHIGGTRPEDVRLYAAYLESKSCP